MADGSCVQKASAVKCHSMHIHELVDTLPTIDQPSIKMLIKY